MIVKQLLARANGLALETCEYYERTLHLIENTWPQIFYPTNPFKTLMLT